MANLKLALVNLRRRERDGCESVALIELLLADCVIGANGRAHNRTAQLPASAAMMQRWADYLDTLHIGADIISLRAVIGFGSAGAVLLFAASRSRGGEAL